VSAKRALAVLAVLAAVPAGAEPLALGPDLAGLGWQEFTFDGLAPNRFIGHEDGALEILGEDSISALYHAVEAPLDKMPCLAWRWRVDESGPPSDLRDPERDDRAVAVYVTYPYDAARAGFWESVVRVFVEMARGEAAPGRVLSYAWGGLGERGEVQPSPFLGAAGEIVLLRPGGEQPNGVWLDECVDIAVDYRRAFGAPAALPSHVAVIADSDNGGTRTHAFVRDIRFVSACP
jgi:hypothetical protein